MATGGPNPVSRWVFERDGNAVASVLLGVAGLLAFGVILGPIAIGLGLMAKRRIRLQRPARVRERRRSAS